jgi:hypothetical protein
VRASDAECDGAFNRGEPSVDLGIHAEDSDIGGFRWEGLFSSTATSLYLFAKLGIVFLSLGTSKHGPNISRSLKHLESER